MWEILLYPAPVKEGSHGEQRDGERESSARKLISLSLEWLQQSGKGGKVKSCCAQDLDVSLITTGSY